ncbi:MAG: hypothetical protein ACRELD_13805 [Longimicrobiales bacterium]
MKARVGRRGVAVVVAMVALAAGCATFRTEARPSPESELERGVVLLRQADYRGAYEVLAELFVERHAEPVGRRALLLLAAAELDPRNAERRMEVGTELLSRHLQVEGWQTWQQPVLESMYLMALELSTAQIELARAQVEAQVTEAQIREALGADEPTASPTPVTLRDENARRLPTLPAASFTAQIGALRRDRDQLRIERTELRTRVTALEQALAEAQAEIERIKRTIRP